MNRASDRAEAQNDRSDDGHAQMIAGNHSQMGKTSGDDESGHHRGNRRKDSESMDDRRMKDKTSDVSESLEHRGNRSREYQFQDDRSIGRGSNIGEIAGGRRGNQMKAQLDHSSGAG